MNWWVILILGIWLFGAIGTGDAEALAFPFIITIVIGFGYFLLKVGE